MSIEFFAYSPDKTPVMVAELAARCRRKGIELRVLREFKGWSSFRDVQEGDIQSDDAVCGWKAAAPSASTIAAAMANGDFAALAVHVANGDLGLFSIEVWDAPHKFNADLADDAKHYPAGYAEARALAAVRFYVRLAAGRGELSASLPETVLGCILELRGGLVDDPQECEFRLAQRGESSSEDAFVVPETVDTDFASPNIYRQTTLSEFAVKEIKGTPGAAERRVQAPGTALMVAGGLGMLANLAMFLIVLAQNSTGGPIRRPAGMDDLQFEAYVRGRDAAPLYMCCAFALPTLFVYPLVLFGGESMRRLRSRGLALTGAILALLPCSLAAAVSIPIGIWALMILNKREVIEAFARHAKRA